MFYEISGDSEESSDRQDLAEGCVVPDADAVLVICRVDDAVAAHVDRDMSVIADDISGPGVGQSVYLRPAFADPGVIVGKGDAEMCVDCHDKAGAVAAVGQAAASPFVGVSDELYGVVDNLLPLAGAPACG